MLNSNSNNSLKLSINSVPGTIVKSHFKSKFMRAHINSPFMKDLDKRGGIVVLQIMQSHDSYVILEYVDKKDYEAEEETR